MKLLIEQAVLLYLLMTDEQTPVCGSRPSWSAHLAYLLCPVDAVPDFIPNVGLTDDLGSSAVPLPR